MLVRQQVFNHKRVHPCPKLFSLCLHHLHHRVRQVEVSLNFHQRLLLQRL